MGWVEIFRHSVFWVRSWVSVGMQVAKTKTFYLFSILGQSSILFNYTRSSTRVIKYSVSTAIITSFYTSVISKSYTLFSAIVTVPETLLLVVLGCGFGWVSQSVAFGTGDGTGWDVRPREFAVYQM